MPDPFYRCLVPKQGKVHRYEAYFFALLRCNRPLQTRFPSLHISPWFTAHEAQTDPTLFVQCLHAEGSGVPFSAGNKNPSTQSVLVFFGKTPQRFQTMPQSH